MQFCSRLLLDSLHIFFSYSVQGLTVQIASQLLAETLPITALITVNTGAIKILGMVLSQTICLQEDEVLDYGVTAKHWGQIGVVERPHVEF